MTQSGFALLILLAVVALIWVRRERWWRKRWERVARALDMRARDADELPEHAFKVWNDYTETRRQSDQRRTFELLLDEISQGLVLLEKNMYIRYANRPLARLLNRTPRAAFRCFRRKSGREQISPDVIF